MTGRLFHFSAPTVGDVVWCRFPYDQVPTPGPKPRPSIILEVFNPVRAGEPSVVTVCYGTSQKVDRIYPGEVLIDRQQHPDEFAAAGLSYPTKFDLRQTFKLPYTSQWFESPPKPRFGAIPKLGSLHAATVPRLKAARKAK